MQLDKAGGSCGDAGRGHNSKRTRSGSEHKKQARLNKPELGVAHVGTGAEPGAHMTAPVTESVGGGGGRSLGATVVCSLPVQPSLYDADMPTLVSLVASLREQLAAANNVAASEMSARHAAEAEANAARVAAGQAADAALLQAARADRAEAHTRAMEQHLLQSQLAGATGPMNEHNKAVKKEE